jgi:RNA polymerase sigma-70 factor (ECF subfamily)
VIDAELVAMAQGGDVAAFSTLATACYSRLHRIAQNILSDLHLAEDATQQTVVEIWRTLPNLRDPGRFEAWSYRILVHACYAEARRSRRWIPGVPDPRDADVSADFSSGIVYRDQLERGFRQLPVDQRAVVVLHHYVGLGLPEVASILGIPQGTAHSRHHRAMQSLRATLEADSRLPRGEAARGEVR